jgi:3-oxoacyl-[acyl-carrier protein] reductase
MSLQSDHSPEDLGVRGKVAVVTAAGRGIGRATALLLSHWGASLVLVDKDGDARRIVRDEILHGGGAAESHATDVCNEAAVKALFTDIASRFDRIDILVNAVGGGKPAALEDISAAEWSRMLDFNVTSCFLCAREAARHMPTGGRIVNIASLAGLSTSQLQGVHYTTAKTAVIGLTRHLARELAPRGILVNAIAPGATLTERIRAQMRPEQERELVARIPLGRLAMPEEQAGAILFLVSSLSSYITGVTIDVSGGYLLT